MTNYTKRVLDGAIDELKREGYQVLVLMLERSNNDEPMKSMEVLCSETNNPLIVAEMAKTALEGLSQNAAPGGPVN